MSTTGTEAADRGLIVACSSCGAEVAIPREHKTATCPYCASAAVVERPPTRERPAARFVVPFALDREAAQQVLRRWLGKRSSFAHSGLRSALVDHARGIYLPGYLYSAKADSAYRASIGEYYTVTETYTTTDSQGKSVTRTRTRTETEWRELNGRHSCYVFDVLVTASRGLRNTELADLEPFDLRAMRRYEPGLIAGWLAEEASLEPAASQQFARAEAEAGVLYRVDEFMPGDVHRDLSASVDLHDEVVVPVLVPVWVFALRYDDEEEPIRILVNGQTGRVVGRVPLSRVRIAVVVALVLVALAALVAFAMGAAR